MGMDGLPGTSMTMAASTVGDDTRSQTITGITGGTTDTGDTTGTLVAGAADEVLVRLREQLTLEVQALLVDAHVEAPQRLASACVALTLLCADVQDDPAEAARYLDLADLHPLAVSLRRELAVALGDRQVLDGAHALGAHLPAGPARSEMMADVASAWLHGFADADRAAAAISVALEQAGPAEVAALGALGSMCFAAHGDHGALTALEVARATSVAAGSIAQAATAVSLLIDRRGDDPAGLALASSVLARTVVGGSAAPADDIEVLRVIDLALEAALRTGEPRTAGLLERRGRVVGTPGEAAEAAAWLALAGLVRTHAPGPAGIADALTALPLSVDGAVGTAVGKLALAIVRGPPRDALVARDRLVATLGDDAGAGVSVAAHRWRAAELVDVLGDGPEAVLRRVRWLHQHAPSDESTRMIEAALWAVDVDGLARAVERAGAPALERAVVVAAGRLGDVPRALRLMRRMLAGEAAPSARALAMLAALLRRSRSLAELADVYERLASTATEAPARARAAWWSAAAMIHLGRGRQAEAVYGFEAALRLAPDELAAPFALVDIYRSNGKWSELATTLAALAPRLSDPTLQAAAQREHALILGTHLGQRPRALAELTALVAQQPDDDAAVLALAALHTDDDPAAAIALLAASYQRTSSPALLEPLRLLYQRTSAWTALAQMFEHALAARTPLAPGSRATLGCQLGELRRDHQDLPLEAVAAFEAVLAHQPDDERALAALDALYATLQRPGDQARTLQRLAARPSTPRAQATALLRLAELRTASDDIDGAMAALSTAFAVDPGDRKVFTTLEALAYRHGRWADVMAVYAAALTDAERGSQAFRIGDISLRQAQVWRRHVGDARAALAACVRALATDGDLDLALHELAQLTPTPADVSAVVAALQQRATAAISDDERGNALLAAARFADGQGAAPAVAAQLVAGLPPTQRQDPEVSALLERIYERAQDWPRLMAVLRLRLSHTPGGPAQVALAGRIAALGEERLRDGGLAAEHYQRMLDVTPDHRDALEALARIYEATERWAEVVEISRRLIPLTTDRIARALLLFRCGSVTEAKFGQEDDAIRYYEAAIKTSPACMPAVHGLRDLYRRRGDWARVVRTLEIEVGLWDDEKEQAGVYALLAAVHAAHLGDAARATYFYDRALKVDPGCIPANLALFERAFAVGDYAAAVARAQVLAAKAMREGDLPARAEFYRKRGVALQATGDDVGAAQSLVQALDIWPMLVGALDELLALAARAPRSFDVTATQRELERQYKRRDDAGPLLARLALAHGAVALRDGDLDEAEARHQAALALAPGDLTVVFAVVEFEQALRRWPTAIAMLRRLVDGGGIDAGNRVRAMRRLARIHADGEIRPESALAVLLELRRLVPSDPDLAYQAAQEAVALGKLDDAASAIDTAIALATAADVTADPVELARYYYYKGRILDGQGEVRAATQHYRRAHEYAPGYAPPVLALARRAVDGADHAGAEALLIEAAHAAIATDGPQGAVPLQRGLARVLLASGDRDAAIEAYRGILGVDPDAGSDRVALAELYAIDDPPRAIVELRRGLERSLYHAPAYRLLASLYERTGVPERATRTLELMAQLGFQAPQDEHAWARLRASTPPPQLHGLLVPDEAQRANILGPALAADGLALTWSIVAPAIEASWPPPSMGERAQLLQPALDPRVHGIVADVSARLGVVAEVFFADRVPGLVAVHTRPRPMVVLDRVLQREPDDGLRFLLGTSLEAVRGGYASLLTLSPRGRGDLRALLHAVLRTAPRPDEAPAIASLRAALPTDARVRAAHAAGDLDLERWIDGLQAATRRAGLLMSGSLLAAAHMIARLAGEPPMVDAGVGVRGLAVVGIELTRFFASDEFHRARRQVT